MKRARYIVGIGLAAGASLGLAHADDGAPAQTIEIHYRMAVWTIPFGALDYTGTFGRGRYSAAMHFRTSGFLGSFWKSAIDNSASGVIAANALLPSTYVSQSVSHNGRRVQAYYVVVVSTEDPDTGATMDEPYPTEVDWTYEGGTTNNPELNGVLLGPNGSIGTLP